MKTIFTFLIGLIFLYNPQQADENSYFYFGNTNFIGTGPMENGKKNGDWNIYQRIDLAELPVASIEAVDGEEISQEFDLSKTVYRISFKNDLPDGILEEYFPNGKIKKLVNYSEGLLDGDFFEFNQHGEILLLGSYFEDQKVGEWNSFYSDGTKKSDFFYEKGLLSGITKNYYPDGTVAELISLNSGQLDGAYQSFFQNGIKQKEVLFQDGKEHGDFILYYPDGKISAKGEFEKGSLSGNWEFFNADGILLSKGTYQAGQKSGEWKEVFEGVAGLYKSGEYLVGLKTGSWKVIDSDGFVYQEEIYIEDKLVSISEFKTISGNLLESGKIKNGNGRRIIFDSEGNILEKGRYAKGKRSGLWYQYFPKTESVASTGNYSGGNKIGTWNYYDFAGQLVSQKDFSKDENADFRNPPTPEKQLEDRLGLGRFFSNQPQSANDLSYLQRFNFVNSTF
jgi:antitoxin component YwqK of YwqJK toxin-antitoxin module